MSDKGMNPTNETDDVFLQKKIQSAFQNAKKLSLQIKQDFPQSRLERDKLWFAEFQNLIAAFIVMQRDHEGFQIEDGSRGRAMFAPDISLPKSIEFCEAMMKTFYSLPKGLLAEEYMFFQFWPSIYNAYAEEAKAEGSNKN